VHRHVLAYGRPNIANYVGKAENKSHGDVQASIYLVMQAYIGIVGPMLNWRHYNFALSIQFAL